jgi:hypothetical protein
MTIHFVSLYFDIESQGILEKKLEMKMAGNPLYILYSDDDSCRAIAPIIRTENFFLECYDGMEEIRSLVIHNRDPVNPDIIVNATCTLNECNQKINIYHSSPFGKDVATAWYGKKALCSLPDIYRSADDHFFYWWRYASAQLAFRELLLRMDASLQLFDLSCE